MSLLSGGPRNGARATRPVASRDDEDLVRSAAARRGRGCFLDLGDIVSGVDGRGDAFRQILAADENDVAAGLAHDRGRFLPSHDVDGPVPAVPGQLQPSHVLRRGQRKAGHPGPQHRADPPPLPGQAPPLPGHRSADQLRPQTTG